MDKSIIRKMLFFYGLSLEEVTKGLGIHGKKHPIKQYIRKQLKSKGQSLPRGFGWKLWTSRWTLEKEIGVVDDYKDTGSILKTAKRNKTTSFEVACILNSVDLLLPEHEHKLG